MTKNIFLQYVRKTERINWHDLELLMLLKGNPFQNVTFFSKNPQKVIEE